MANHILMSSVANATGILRADPQALAAIGVPLLPIDGGLTLAILMGVAVGVPTYRRFMRWRKERDVKSGAEIPPELASAVAAPDSVRRIYEVLRENPNRRATSVLASELDRLMDEPDWQRIVDRLDKAAEEWCEGQKGREDKKLTPGELSKALLGRIRNVREATYRELFAEHYREIISVDRRDRPRVDEVFMRLQAQSREQASGEQKTPKYLDFRGKTPTEIDATLRQSGNLVILGEPGSGKSTLLRHLAASCAQSEAATPLLPVFLRLRDYASGQESIIADSAVASAQGGLQLKMRDGFFDDALSGGRCVFFLDALDEVPDEERFRVVRAVEALTRRYTRSRFIVTSRIAGYDEAPLDREIFTRCVAEPMDDAGIAAFIDRLCPDDPKRAENLHDVLNTNPGIKALASNPLHMAMLDLVYPDDDREGFPLDRAKLYEKTVDYLIDDKDDAGRKINPDGRQTHERLLTATALFLHNENRETIGREELAELAAERLLEIQGKADAPTEEDEGRAYEEAESFIERAERRTGLLAEQEPGSGVFGFVHHATFREYLTAKDIYLRHRGYRRHHQECWEEIEGHLTDPRWREIILLLLGSFYEDYCTYLTQQILAAGDKTIDLSDWRLPINLELAADALVNQAPMSPALQRTIIGLLERIGKGITGDGRNFSSFTAVRSLGKIRHIPEEVTGSLTTIAIDSGIRPEIRLSAAEKLAEFLEEEKSISLLIAIATDPTFWVWVWDWYDAEHLAWGETTDGKTNAKRIASFIGISRDPEVDIHSRARATLELAKFGGSVTGDSLLEGICTNSEVDVDSRVCAASAFEYGGGETAVSLLTDIASDLEVDADSRVQHAHVLAELGELEKAVSLLTDIAKDPEVDVDSRVRAAELLLGFEFGVEARARAASLLPDIASYMEVDAGKRVEAAEALALLGAWGTSIPLLIDYNAPGVDADRRVDVDRELERCREWEKKISLRNESAVAPPADAWRRVLAACSGWIQDWNLLSHPELGSDRVSYWLDRAQYAAAYVKEEQIEAELENISNDWTAHSWDRVTAAVALRIWEEMNAALPILTHIANSESVDDVGRINAARLLGALDEEEWDIPAINILTVVAGDEPAEPFLRLEACKGLIDLGRAKPTIGPLTTVAKEAEADPVVRIEAAKILGNLGETETAEPVLQTIAGDQSLSRTNRRDALNVLRELREGRSDSMR